MTDSAEIGDILERAKELARMAGYEFASSSKIEVNAGGAATWVTAWVCSVCAAFMAGAMLVGGFWVSGELSRSAQERAELRRTDNDIRDYMAAIYQAAPELQKRIEAEQAKASK